ncbi:cation diffusion facilitator family transporter [Dactylosporangium fulvum]|uniref:Cation diffusion facilitator family transporter n=1 Tax=Dactylosporangium fulvum TaxID=53359 RepID=A0ABY5VXI0_9ACTN|nr:cation diffusion facilitator family transporter [Dactylosporangium fulvum]UWP81831.1 cation diffusion facilitator family transporter [Dactylosporangium fulvum]
MAEEGNSFRAILAALAANLGIALSKFVAYLFTGSSSLLAETVHSVADTANQVLLLIGGRRARQRASQLHPFGYARFRYFYGFLVTLVIFLVGGVFALFEGYEKLHHPKPVESPVWAFAVLGVSIALESFSLRTAVREAEPSRHGLSWLRFIRTTRSPELPVVLAEDFGALTGLTFALFGITLAVITGDGRWDAIGTLAIGVLLVVISITLSQRMRSLLIGESADNVTLRRIEAAIESEPPIERVIHLRTSHLGPDQLLIAAKVAVPAEETMAQVAKAINRAEARIRAEVDHECFIFLEPDVFDQRLFEAADRPPGSSQEPGWD